MDPDMLAVRFHLVGQFDYDGQLLHYVGGRVEMSYIERDKLSLPELRGHLGDHVALTPEHNVDFHWLFPGSGLSNGLRKISDDKTCIFMSECIIDGGVAELYVEIYNIVRGDVVMWSCDEPTQHPATNDIEKVKAYCSLPIKRRDADSSNESEDHESGEEEESEADSDSEDEDYLEGDEDTSEDDEEAKEFRSNAMNQRNNPATTAGPKAPVTASKVQIYESDDGEINHDIPDPPMMNSSDEASYDDNDEGEASRKKSRFARFDSTADIPKFCVGMTSGGRDEFKAALIKYGLEIRRHLMFPI